MGDLGVFGAWLVLASDRSERILNARQRIPTLLWCALIFGGAVSTLLTCFMRLENGRDHAILVGAVAILLSLLMYVIFTLDHPFGPIGVTSQPFSHAVKVFDMVDRGS